MQAEQIVLDREKARALWRDYKKHQHWSAPVDQEVMRTYHAIAQGRVVIKALESIRVAGCNAEGLPKLALARATAAHCHLRLQANGTCVMADTENALWRSNSRRFTFPDNSIPGLTTKGIWRAQAVMPLVPLTLRPKRGLANYHVLWEAEWKVQVPVDPMLLRRIGEADLWIVVAAWELSPVEQAVIAGRLNG